MNTAAIKLSDVLADALSVPMERAQKVEKAVEKTVDVRLEETVGKAVPPLVDRSVATELKHLATKEDLKNLEVEMYKMKVEMHKMGNRTILWMAGILIAILGGFIATLFTLLQTRPIF